MISVRNLYYMLLYAWGHFRSSEVQEVGEDESPDLPNLLAKVLNDRTHRLLRQGLDQGYVGTVEETRSLRGKLKLDEMAKRQTLLRGAAICEVDERTPDILHNRILRETLLRLVACKDVDKALRHELLVTARRMRDVSRIPLTSGVFHRVQLSRNTAQYGLLMRICEMVFHALMPDEQGQGSRFLSILDDEIRMSALFEEFLRKFYNQELPGYRASSEIARWDATAENFADIAYLPVMRTDISIRSHDRLLIVEAKYTPKLLAKGQYRETVQSLHLYQLTTYLSNAKRTEPDTIIDGMLIYPYAGRDIELNYTIFGTKVKVATIDLSRDWRTIHYRLQDLATAIHRAERTISQFNMAVNSGDVHATDPRDNESFPN